MKRLLIGFLLCLPLTSNAQDFIGWPGFPLLNNDGASITRSIPLNTSGNVAATLAAYGVTPTFCKEFSGAVGATHTGTCGGAPALTMTVVGTPVLTSVPLWPATIAGTAGGAWTMSGGQLSVADNAAFEPAGSFTVVCAINPSTIAAGTYALISHDETTGNQHSWSLYQSAASVVFATSANGTDITTNTKTTALAAGRPAFITAAYTYVGAATSVSNIWVDGLTVQTSSTMAGPVFNSTATDEIGASDTGANLFSGRQNVCAILGGTVGTAAQHTSAFATWQGRASWGGNVVSVASAAPPAIMMAPPGSGIYPFLVPQPAASSYIGSPATGSGGLYSASAISNLAQRSSLETWAAGAPTGWTEAVTSTGDCAQSTVAPANLVSAARCTLADADDAVTLTGACLTVTGGHLCRLAGYAKTVSGTGLLDLNLLEDNDTDCSSITSTTAVVDNWVPGATYTRGDGTITLGAATTRAQVQISLPAAAAQVLDIDAIQLRCQATIAPLAEDAYCGTDTDATAACNRLAINAPNPITWLGPASMVWTNRFPYNGTDKTGNEKFFSTYTSGGNYFNIAINNSTDEPSVIIYDNASAAMSVTPNSGNMLKDTDYTYKFKYNNAGAMAFFSNSAWVTTTAGAGTGILSATKPTLVFEEGGTCQGVWFRDITVYRKLIP
jgi:hypothetical protein